jgi:hypothetical protein
MPINSGHPIVTPDFTNIYYQRKFVHYSSDATFV